MTQERNSKGDPEAFVPYEVQEEDGATFRVLATMRKASTAEVLDLLLQRDKEDALLRRHQAGRHNALPKQVTPCKLEPSTVDYREESLTDSRHGSSRS